MDIKRRVVLWCRDCQRWEERVIHLWFAVLIAFTALSERRSKLHSCYFLFFCVITYICCVITYICCVITYICCVITYICCVITYICCVITYICCVINLRTSTDIIRTTPRQYKTRGGRKNLPFIAEISSCFPSNNKLSCFSYSKQKFIQSRQGAGLRANRNKRGSNFG